MVYIHPKDAAELLFVGCSLAVRCWVQEAKGFQSCARGALLALFFSERPVDISCNCSRSVILTSLEFLF